MCIPKGKSTVSPTGPAFTQTRIHTAGPSRPSRVKKKERRKKKKKKEKQVKVGLLLPGIWTERMSVAAQFFVSITRRWQAVEVQLLLLPSNFPTYSER